MAYRNFSNVVFILVLISGINSCSNAPIHYESAQSVSSKGAILSTDYPSLESLKNDIRMDYSSTTSLFKDKKAVKLSYSGIKQHAVSILESGISEDDFRAAANGDRKKQIQLVFNVPYFVRNRKDLERVSNLARRNFRLYGEKDLAFYQLAEAMVDNIDDGDLAMASSKDLTEKGYINTFNHITAQAFMTVLFSEKLADFIADVHERKNMPQLITGIFSDEQISDLQTGPVDNYVDMLNNEWGQELGKKLKKKYNISRRTYWTPQLLADFLNDIQRHYTWSLQIGFQPFTKDEELIIIYSEKINHVMEIESP